MKKILIATVCAFTLCLTSCASKKAPAEETQTEAPETETTQDLNDSNEEESESSNENTSENEEVSEAKDSVVLVSEGFPEPEFIDEPVIITLEPEDEIEEESPAPTEAIEEEEPPEITIVNPGETENTEISQTSEDDTLPSDENENSDSDITEAENDIILVDNTSDSDNISGGIDITDEDSSANDNYNEIQKEITPSRSVTLKKFEYLDVTYPGSGWIYMGLTDNSKDLAYFGRKLGTKDTKFSLQARAAGTKIIHFYRNDPLTGQYLDDYIEVIITAENGSNKTHIAAPEYKLPVQKKEKQVKQKEEQSSEATEKTEKAGTTENSSDSSKATENLNSPSTKTIKTGTVNAAETTSKTSAATTATAGTGSAADTETAAGSNTAAGTGTAVSSDTAGSSGTTAVTDSSLLLKEAQILYNEKEYSAALTKLNQFFEYSTDKRDEALFLKGQILEAKSDVRDIKGAIEAYTTLTKNYPASKLWDDANKRIIYLKRFYLEVRQIL